jgi:hypothetical protein
MYYAVFFYLELSNENLSEKENRSSLLYCYKQIYLHMNYMQQKTSIQACA